MALRQSPQETQKRPWAIALLIIISVNNALSLAPRKRHMQLQIIVTLTMLWLVISHAKRLHHWVGLGVPLFLFMRVGSMHEASSGYAYVKSWIVHSDLISCLSSNPFQLNCSACAQEFVASWTVHLQSILVLLSTVRKKCFCSVSIGLGFVG